METSLALPPAQAPIVSTVVQRHADEASSLSGARTALTVAPQVTLAHLRGFDGRLDAHMEGLAIAGEAGWRLCETALESPSAGVVFMAAARALEDQRRERFGRLVALAKAVPAARQGLTNALEWVQPKHLEGLVVRLLGSADAFERRLGVSACGRHRVRSAPSTSHVRDAETSVRARALRVAGEIGDMQAAVACEAAIAGDDDSCRWWGTWSSVVLGNRGRSLDALAHMALHDGPHRGRAFPLALQATGVTAGHRLLQDLARRPRQQRWVIAGAGVVGDPVYVRWLIDQMRCPELSRVAGEAFSLITGADLEALGLEAPAPENLPLGPNDDPDDSNVDVDPDDGLPWPDPQKVERWWASNDTRFPSGTRCFMGAPVTREHCIEVLKNGYQRQRVLAAHYLCLLEPGTPLFNTSAPAWRQQRLLAKMG